MRQKWGVIVTDIQGDFTEWKEGSLAVPGTPVEYVREVEAATRLLKAKGIPIFATQDWHPPDHVSFYTNHPGARPFETIVIDGRSQILWPPHCVQGTENARVLVDNGIFLAIVKKAVDAAFDGYSGFRDDGDRKTGLDDVLRQNEVDKLIIYGLATDYCVRATSMDAVAAGYLTYVVKRLSRGIAPDTTDEAIEQMGRAGVRIVETLGQALAEDESPEEG